MIKIANLKKISFKDKKLNWYDLNNPSDEDLDLLAKKFKLHHLDLDDLKSDIQRAKIDEYKDYLFIILNIPRKNTKHGYIQKSQIYFFMGENFIVTVHQKDPVLSKVYKKIKRSKKAYDEYMTKEISYFLYMLVDDLFENCFPILDDLELQYSQLESEVFSRKRTVDRLREILALKKDLINFRTIIMPQRSIIALLEHKHKKFVASDLELYFDDIVDKIEKIWNNLGNLYELSNTLHETNESLISHNTNNIIKILTVVSVVMMPLTFITGFYGMNLSGLPFAEQAQSVAIVSGLLFSVALLMVLFFKIKKWI